MIRFILVFVFSLTFFSTSAQILDSLESTMSRWEHYLLYREYDTNYISNYGDAVGIRLLAMNKSNYFAIHDFKNKSSIRYRPSRDLYLGLGFAYKWIAADFSLSLGLYDNDDVTRAFDFQGRVFTSKHYLGGTLQYYRKYFVQDQRGTSVAIPDSMSERGDIRTTNFEISYLYTLNYTRFSLKAPFVFNDLQRKSAGSPLFGASFNLFNLYADSSVVPHAVRPDFVPDANLTNLSVLSLGVNAGYMYSLVFKERFFITVSLIPGVHYNVGDFSAGSLSQINGNLNLKLSSMNSAGYNGRRFYAGVYYMYNGQLNRIREGLFAETGHAKMAAFVGYRFGLKKGKSE